MISNVKLPAMPVLGLMAIQFVLFVSGILLFEGGAMWLVLALATLGLALTGMLMRPGSTAVSDELLQVLRTVNEAQGDLSLRMRESGDARSVETAKLFNQFMERLRAALEDLRNHSIRVTLTSAQGRKIAEQASVDAGKQEDYSEIIYNSSEETATAIEQLSRWTSNIADLNSRNLPLPSRLSVNCSRRIVRSAASAT